MLTESALHARALRPARASHLKATLRPVSHPQLGEIRISGGVFAIGRNEEPFASRLGESAARLSRRHARIFEEDGKFFVADLGSRNGTRINSRAVHGGPAVLVSNDVVTFGGEVSFKVAIEHDTSLDRTFARQTPAVRLHLTPADPSSPLDTLVIERFPFLIARVGGAFEQYRERLPDAVKKLSRRHAVITLRGDDLYIEDLESSNGTFIDGKRLDERARQLENGQKVVFGSDEFAYTVRVEQQADEATRLVAPARVAEPPASRADAESRKGGVAAEPAGPRAAAAEPAAEAPADHANRTRFVSSADSFLNVFCVEDAPSGEEPGAGESAEASQAKEPRGVLRRWRSRLKSVSRASAETRRTSRKLIWGVVGAVALVAAVGLGAYVVSMERRAIGAHLEAGEYAESAVIANRYLARNQDDREASAWAEEALTRATVPGWIERIEAGRYAEAAQYLQDQRKRHENIAGGLAMLDLLAWAGEVEAHMAERGGASAPIVIFHHEDAIERLVAAWDKDRFRRQQIMDQIAGREPTFEPVRRRVYADLRALRSDNALYVKAIGELKKQLSAALAKHDWPGVEKLLQDFAAHYPRVEGLEPLRADLASLKGLASAAERRDMQALRRLTRETRFATALVAQHAERWLAQSTPPESVLTQHARAAQEWAAGRHAQAISLLEPLRQGAWGEIAEQQIAHYRKIDGEYAALVAARGAPDYSDRLLTLWGALHPKEDAHLRRALEPDFLAHREQLAPRLQASLRTMRKEWDAYESAGGIPGVIRVEGRVSERFAGQARRLTRAHEEATTSARTYELLQIEPPDEWRSLGTEIAAEVQRQRRWLEDLNIVLEPALLRAKLDLLPKTSESSQWLQSTTAQEVD